MTTALLTDHYELTMVQAALAAGTADRRAVFELFPRRLPEGRRYGVVAGVQRALDAIEEFTFDDAAIAALRDGDVVDEATLEWLAGYRFSGDIWGYPEGEIYFPYSPLMVVESTFADAVVLETLLLSILNHDSAIASAASRMTWAAERPPLHRDGLAADPRGGRGRLRPGGVRRRASPRPPTWRPGSATASRPPAPARTASRCCTTRSETRSRHRSSRSAAAPRCSSTPTTSPRPCRLRSRSPAPELGAVRLDSGDLALLAQEVRVQLDELGATETRIIVTSDLDEFAIAGLASAPVDGYGVGTSLVTGSGHPTCGFVYKLVARAGDDGEMVDVAKRSKDKISIGGRKYALRRRNAKGCAEAEVIGIGEPPVDDGDDRPLLVPLVRDGKVVGREDLDTIRARHEASRAELPVKARQLSRGEPVIPTEHVGA